jgi:sugar/nucleoside kinase (ribokinase family)
MERSGIICGGAWCIDRNYAIDEWPPEETVATVHSVADLGGCPGHNMSTALKRLGAPFPVEAIGLIGDDEEGRMLARICDGMGIGRQALEVRPGVATSLTLAMTARATGKRTFFHMPGAHAIQTPDDFDFSRTSARIAHLGLPGLHPKLDARWKDDVSGWVAVIKKAKALGIATNIELVSIAPERVRAVAEPLLGHLETLIVNDYEAGAITGIATVRGGSADPASCRAAAERLMEGTALSLAAVHYPMGAVVLARDGGRAEMPSVDVPRAEVVSSNGAGDCFAAGILLGHHEGWPLEQSLKLAHASAAASLRAAGTSTSVLPWSECLVLAGRWGFRQ